jgi:hypothetical protein
MDWSADPATGSNLPLCGNDATLISKHDFHTLVEEVVDSLPDDDFSSWFSTNTSKETIVEFIAASYWPRVRLLQYWRDKNVRFYSLIPTRIVDSGSIGCVAGYGVRPYQFSETKS